MNLVVNSLFFMVFVFSEVHAGNQKCNNPKGRNGESYTEGCIKKTCKSGTWRPSLDEWFCCFNRESYQPGTTITSVSDGCSTAYLWCRDDGDKATLALEVKNKCGGYSTEKQVSELKEMLENHVKNTGCESTPKSETTTTDNRKGILVSGAQSSVEILVPETGQTFNLPFLPNNKKGHTWRILYNGTYVSVYDEQSTSTSVPTSETTTVPYDTRKGSIYGPGDKVYSGDWSWRPLPNGTYVRVYDEQYTPTYTPTSETTITDTRKGILISGGWGAQTSAEIFSPETGQTCTLPDLPDNRNGHTMDIVQLTGSPKKRAVICGGGADDSQTTCLYINQTAWDTIPLMRRRDGHTSWVSSAGLTLLGGEHSRSTTEEIDIDGSLGLGPFELVKDTRYACSIPDKDSVVLTGGRDTMKDVARYNLQGFVEYLPEMNDGRRYHGCGSYYVDGTLVLIVTGGRTSYGYSGITDSTEKLIVGATAWTRAEPLPRAMIAMASVSLDNKVFVTGGGRGGRDDGHSRRSEILAFDGDHWEEVGQLQIARNFHAATSIDLADFPGLCTHLE